MSSSAFDPQVHRTLMTKDAAKQYQSTANSVRQPLWNLNNAGDYLEKWVEQNSDPKAYAGNLVPLSFFVGPPVRSAQPNPGPALHWSEFAPDEANEAPGVWVGILVNARCSICVSFKFRLELRLRLRLRRGPCFSLNLDLSVSVAVSISVSVFVSVTVAFVILVALSLCLPCTSVRKYSMWVLGVCIS